MKHHEMHARMPPCVGAQQQRGRMARLQAGVKAPPGRGPAERHRPQARRTRGLLRHGSRRPRGGRAAATGRQGAARRPRALRGRRAQQTVASRAASLVEASEATGRPARRDGASVSVQASQVRAQLEACNHRFSAVLARGREGVCALAGGGLQRQRREARGKRRCGSRGAACRSACSAASGPGGAARRRPAGVWRVGQWVFL